jgi:nucleotide-binding universal stress UspA family protein
MNRIVVGLDGTPKDRPLVNWITDFADEVGARVIPAHFVPSATVWMVAGAQVDCTAYLEELRGYFERDVLRPLQDRDPLLHMHIHIGDPAHELATLALHSDADLIAIGARDHSMLHDVVFGNLERQLMHRSDIPVLTVPCRARTLHVVH